MLEIRTLSVLVEDFRTLLSSHLNKKDVLTLSYSGIFEPVIKRKEKGMKRCMEKMVKEVAGKDEMTRVSALIRIFNSTRGTGMSAECLESISKEVEFLGHALQLNAVQCMMVAVLLNEDGACCYNEFAEHIGVNNIEMQRYRTDLNDLIRRDLVFYARKIVSEGRKVAYCLDGELGKAICNDTPYTSSYINEWSLYQMLVHVNRRCIAKAEGSLDYESFKGEVIRIVNETQHLDFSLALRSMELEFEDMLMVLLAAKCIVVDDEFCIVPNDYEKLFKNKVIERRVCESIFRGTGKLAKDNIMETDKDEDDFATGATFYLTEKAMHKLLPEYSSSSTRKRKLSRDVLMEADSLQERKLFYNDGERVQVDTLAHLLDQTHFVDVQNRLRDAGMRSGFACLLYGGPGTGKTETVYQLARRTGRAVMRVNIPEIRDKFVGETEKRLKHLFDSYREFVDESREDGSPCPILFFNEADAIISKRTENVDRGVDKMENAMQNIILQEMEQLDGIMIATTNLTSTMDSAFERRFIYKIELSKPSRAVKRCIWQSMLPQLCEQDADVLASSYDFSGGQIENIVRKHTIDWVLFGRELSLDDLRRLCNEENINGSGIHSRVGFCA